MFKSIFLLLGSLLLSCISQGQIHNNSVDSKVFLLGSSTQPTLIYMDNKAPTAIQIAAKSLCRDMAMITGKAPVLTTDRKLRPYCSVIIQMDSTIATKLPADVVQGKWEYFVLSIKTNTSLSEKEAKSATYKKQDRQLYITGTDPRGTVYGIFSLSRFIGVSPWVWWSDAPPTRKDSILLPGDFHRAEGPSVRYRGIFINDEDWGLRPWAAKNLDAAIHNIGPNTYAKVFELLLRLRANTIWPAMHPGTTPFFQIPANKEVAKKYAIIIGTSHAEPMMRNNVGEWDEKTRGAFNYKTNQKSLYNYWAERVSQIADNDNMYTIGLRGVHDSKMEGAGSIAEQKSLLQKAIDDQRSILAKYTGKEAKQIPQVFIPYKEVLPIYDAGLKLPDDITLMWTDDNYGYIRRLSNAQEQKRSGGGGIYYHLSYWGRPHDYLWLSSTQPALIYEELKKAWDYNTKNIWIANVGDIKPAAYNIQLFLDMAWNIHCVDHNSLPKHLEQWLLPVFGSVLSPEISNILQSYYHLAFIRRPEFMGWSQTEPTSQVKNSDFQPFKNGDEISSRLSAYKALAGKARAVSDQLPASVKDAYFEWVLYPVLGSLYMNQKLLYAQKSRLFAKYQFPVANTYKAKAIKAYNNIQQLTNYYNHGLAAGKWAGIMDAAPRKLPVFQLPPLPDSVVSQQGTRSWSIWPENSDQPISKDTAGLPVFDPEFRQAYFFTLLNKSTTPINWQITGRPDWTLVSKTNGVLQSEQKVAVRIDWTKVPAGSKEGLLSVEAGGQKRFIKLQLEGSGHQLQDKEQDLTKNKAAATYSRYIFQGDQYTAKYSSDTAHPWQTISGLGVSGASIALWPVPTTVDIGTDSTYKKSWVEYEFNRSKTGKGLIQIRTLPSLPVQNNTAMRLGIQIDGGSMIIMDYQTFDRSRTWKQNVLRNQAILEMQHNFQKTGTHKIRLYPLDPGVTI
ncbi:MAG TPA: glycosyl hydrolase 115 family protein, partial [Arachidicoccus sp.]|nr:glycosyl hydrolase 115 family protein [Arachidicoccus sp.]